METLSFAWHFSTEITSSQKMYFVQDVSSCQLRFQYVIVSDSVHAGWSWTS